MIRSLLAIVSNTFTEILRQPVYGVVIGATVLLLVFSPSLTMFTMDDDNKLLMDIGLSTLLVSGLFLAVFASATVVTDEIENKTVLTVITKTVSRPVLIVGKFLGTAAAVVLAQYFLSLVFIMIVRHGVRIRAASEHDWVVITLGSSAAAIVFLVGMAGNYFYRWRFSTTAITLGTILSTFIIAFLAFFDVDWHFNPAENNLHPELIGPILLTVLATLILTALAVASATRLGLVMTLIFCSTIFVLGACVQYWLGPVAAQSGIAGYFAWAGLAIVPSINIYVVTNAIYEGNSVSLAYIGQTAIYALCYVVAVLLFAIALFRRREVG